MGKTKKCAQCKTVFANDSDRRHCSDCKANYCDSHFTLGEWTRFVITMDEDMREVTCPKGHSSWEKEP